MSDDRAAEPSQPGESPDPRFARRTDTAARERVVPSPARGPDAHEVPPPMEAVRSDVSRIAELFRSIHSRYLWAGIVLYAGTAILGVILALTAPARDWFMHLAMYAVVCVFILFYLHAHQVRRRVARGFYALVVIALVGFFAWVLVDLVPARLEVVDSDVTRPDGTVVPGPTVIERPRTPAFFVSAGLLGLTGLWLACHWLILSRFRRDETDDEVPAVP